MIAEEMLILLVEDNDDDAELTVHAFQHAKVVHSLVRVRDGLAALDFLFGRGPFADRDAQDLPVVMLLDLNLPKIGGLNVLKAIRSDVRTRHLPVVVLTTSNEEKDRFEAYNAFANSYVLKPVDYDKFVVATAQITQYWTSLNAPPPAAVDGF